AIAYSLGRILPVTVIEKRYNSHLAGMRQCGTSTTFELRFFDHSVEGGTICNLEAMLAPYRSDGMISRPVPAPGPLGWITGSPAFPRNRGAGRTVSSHITVEHLAPCT